MAIGRFGELLGRRAELAALHRLVDDVTGCESRVLVVIGPPGIGKTAVLRDGLASTGRARVLQITGIESEMSLAFGALHQLCAPIIDRIDRLPGPQHDAVAQVFGLAAGGPPDRFMVALAVLTLLTDVGAEQPLVCAIDDAHWLDPASVEVLAFVARRLHADPVGLVFAARRPPEALAGFPALRLEGLTTDDSAALLESSSPFVLDEEVRHRILGEARGNPLALLELPRGLSPGELTGASGHLAATPVESRVELAYRQRIEALPAAARRFVLVAAAEPTANLMVIQRAADALGAGHHAPAAEAAGLLELGSRCGSATHSSEVPPTPLRHLRSGARRTAPSPPRPTPGEIPIDGRGTSRRRRSARMIGWPPSWSARPRRPRHVGVMPRLRRSWSARRACPPSRR